MKKWEREKQMKNEKTPHVVQKQHKGLRKWRGKKEKRRLKRRRTRRAIPLISSDLIGKIKEGETEGGKKRKRTKQRQSLRLPTLLEWCPLYHNLTNNDDNCV